jgi:hypothetical protein
VVIEVQYVLLEAEQLADLPLGQKRILPSESPRPELARKLLSRILVVRDGIDLVDAEGACTQTVLNGIHGKAAIVLSPGQTLLGDRGDELAVAQKACG